MAETIENNLRKVIIDERPTNPTYYDKMSELLDTLIQQRQHQAQEYEHYLARIIELAKQVQNPTGLTAYPKALNTRAKRALYDNLGKNEQLAITLDAKIQHTKKDGWRGNRIKEREVRYSMRHRTPLGIQFQPFPDIFSLEKQAGSFNVRESRLWMVFSYTSYPLTSTSR